MNLLIDIGNTFTHIAVAGKTRLLFEFKLSTHSRVSSGDIMRRISRYKKKIKHSAIASVVPHKDEFWQHFSEKNFNIKPIVVSYRTGMPIKIKVEKPQTLGTDRICNAVAAYTMFKGKFNVIVIDLGTATTYDVILKNGYFIGGIIAPGIETSAKALHANTGKLPLLGFKQLRFPRKVIGRNTMEAIQSGLMYSASISVDGMIRQIEKDHGRKFRIILTGGLSKIVYRRINYKAKLEKNMVLKGLNEIIKYNNLV